MKNGSSKLKPRTRRCEVKGTNIRYIRLDRLRTFKVNKYRDAYGNVLPFSPEEINAEITRKEDNLEKKILQKVRSERDTELGLSLGLNSGHLKEKPHVLDELYTRRYKS